MIELNRIYCESCLDTMAKMPENFVDLTITSPPYDSLRDYNKFSFNFKDIAKNLYKVTKEGGVVVWVVGDSVVKGSETGTSFKHALLFKKFGFNLHDTMIYVKNCFPFPPKVRYYQCFEYMFVLSKGKPKTVNLIQVPKQQNNISCNKKISSSIRIKNGRTEKFKCDISNKFRIKENVWKYEVGYMKTTKDKEAFKHPAMFPEKLAKDHIITWSNAGDLVYDPFIGAGTTAKIAKLNDRNFIGSEISKEYYEIALNRLKN